MGQSTDPNAGAHLETPLALPSVAGGHAARKRPMLQSHTHICK